MERKHEYLLFTNMKKGVKRKGKKNCFAIKMRINFSTNNGIKVILGEYMNVCGFVFLDTTLF